MGWHDFRRTTAVSLALAATTIAVAPLTSAQSSTKAYDYDALGRLIKMATTGGQNSGETNSLCYDPAGNRTQYKSSADGSATACAGGSPPPLPSGSFSVNSASAMEGNPVNFTVSLSPAQTSSVTVAYATAHGTAGAADYIAASGTLTFSPGQTSKSLAIATNADFKNENTEVFYLNLTAPSSGLAIGSGQGTGSIFNDDSNCATCSAANAPSELSAESELSKQTAESDQFVQTEQTEQSAEPIETEEPGGFDL